MEYSENPSDAHPSRMTEFFSPEGFLAVYIECVVVEITTTVGHTVITDAIKGEDNFAKKRAMAMSFAQFCQYCCNQRIDPGMCARELADRLGWTSQVYTDEDGYEENYD